MDDFDFTRPKARLTAQVARPRETGHPDYEHYNWPGDYYTRDEGEFLTRVRMENERAKGSRATGNGAVRTLATGYTFTLENCPTVDANREYLVLSTSHLIQDTGEHSGQEQVFQYSVAFELLPTSEVFRPERTITKPHTRGPQSAIVTGPPGEEIHTDQYGRIKVQFPWDRYGQWDENSSCWIRVSQPWAGKGFGGMQIPRIGQEVLVDFKNGDPDLPIVVGRVYNADTMPPWGLPDNKTQSGMFSHTIGGGPYNANALRFEDKPGAEELWLHAERDQRIEVRNDESHCIGNNRVKAIGENETATIGASRNHTVKVDDTSLVGKDKTVQVVNKFLLAAGDSITLSCGDTILELCSSGKVSLTCKEFNITATENGQINTQAGQLDLNMDNRKASVTPKGSVEKTNMDAACEKIFPDKRVKEVKKGAAQDEQ